MSSSYTRRFCSVLFFMLLFGSFSFTTASAQSRGGFSFCGVTPMGDNQTIQTGAFSSPMSLRFDDGSVPIPGLDVEVFVFSGSGLINGQAPMVLLQTDNNGDVSFNFQADQNPGTVIIGSFSPFCITGGMHDFFVNVVSAPPPPDNVINPISGNNSTGTLGQPLPDPLVIEYLTDDGTPIPNTDLDWFVSGDATLDFAHTMTDSMGRSSNNVTLGTTPGTVFVDVIDPDASGTLFTFTINSAPPSVMFPTNVMPPQVSLGGLSDPFSVQVLDNAGGPMENVEVFWSLNGSSLKASTLVDSSTFTDANGMAGNQLMADLNMTGTVTVSASVFNNAASDSLNISVDAPIIGIHAGNGQTGGVGETLEDLVIELSLPSSSSVQKSFEGVPISWSVINGDASLSASSSMADAQGFARIGITLGSNEGNNQIMATAPGMGSVVFNATTQTGPPPGSQLTIVSGNPQMTVPGRRSAPLVVALNDPDGQPISGQTISWTSSPGNTPDVTFATLSDTSTVTGSDGQTQITAIPNLPIPITVTAAITDSPDISSVTFNLNTAVANDNSFNDRQRGAAAAIDSACPALFVMQDSLDAPSSDLLARCSEIVGAVSDDPNGVARVLDNLTTEESASQGAVATETNVTQVRNVKARMLALRQGSTGIDATGLVMRSGDTSLPVSAFSSFMQNDADVSGGGSPDFGPWGFFINGRFTTGEKDSTSTEVGFDFDSYGITLGVDYRVNSSFVIGAALGYNDVDNDINNNQGNLEVDGYNFTGYATWYNPSSYYLDTLLTFGNNDLDSRRNINYSIGTTTVNQVAIGTPDSDSLGFAVSFGRDFSTANRIFSPYLRVDYTDIEIDGYAETLSNPNADGSGLGLLVGDQDIESLEAVLGARMSWSLSRDWGVMVPVLNFEYAHEFDDDSRVISASFLNDPTSTAFTTVTDDPDRNYFNLGAGISFVFSNGRSMYINYDTIVGLSDVTQHTLRIGGRFEF